MTETFNDILKGLEPETQAAFKNSLGTYWNQADVEHVTAHSQAVSAVKANAIMAHNTQVMQNLIEEIQSIQTYGLRLNDGKR